MKTVKTIKDLIMHKDYDYVDYRILLPDAFEQPVAKFFH